jgi:tetratricopeptide (TPR) repeat protein
MGGSENKKSLALIILFFASVFALFADKLPVTLENAEALEKGNKPDQAMVIYEEWLKEHTSDERFAEILVRCGELKKNPYDAINLYRDNRSFISNPSEKKTIDKKIAVLYSMLGDYRAALLFFKQAFALIDSAHGDDPWIVTVAFISIAAGEFDEAYDWIRNINPIVHEPELRAGLNYALLEIYLAKNDISSAEKAFSIIEKEFKQSNARPRALLRFCSFFLSAHDEDKANKYYQILQKEFPASLEFTAAAAMVKHENTGLISLTSTPLEIIGGSGIEKELIKKTIEQPETKKIEESLQPSDAAAKNDGKAGNLRIQVGSYTMHENAQEMVKDLTRIKIEAEIVEVMINNRKYYRVFVGQSLSFDEAQTLLALLQDHAIGGYIYNEVQ